MGGAASESASSARDKVFARLPWDPVLHVTVITVRFRGPGLCVYVNTDTVCFFSLAMVPWSFRSVLNALVEHNPDVYDKAVKILEDELQPWEGLRDLIEGDGATARMERVARNLQAEQLEVTADMLRLAVRLILGIEPRKREGQAQVPPAPARSTLHPL